MGRGRQPSLPAAAPGVDMAPAGYMSLGALTGRDIQRELRATVLEILASTDTFPQAAPRVLRALGDRLGWDAGALWVRKRSGRRLRCIATWFRATGRSRTFEGAAGRRGGKRGGLTGRILETRSPLWIADLSKTRDPLNGRLARSEGLRSALGVPVRQGNRLLGILGFYGLRPRQRDEAQIEFVAAIGRHISSFVQRERSRVAKSDRYARELSRRSAAEERATRDAGAARRQLALLAEVSRLLATSLDVDATASSIAKLVVPALANWCRIDIFEDGGTTLRRTFHNGVSDRLPKGPAAAAPAGRRAHPHHLDILRRLRRGSAMMVPFVTGRRALGALTLVSTNNGRQYGTEDLAFAEELARRATLAIDNALLHRAEQSARRFAEDARDRMARLQAITSALSRAVTVSEVGDAIVERGMRALGAMAGSMSVLAPDGSELALVRERGYPPELARDWQRVLLSTPTEATAAVKSGEPVVLSEEKARARYPQLRIWDLLRCGPHVAVPLIAARRPLGVLGFTFPQERHLAAEDQALLLSIAQQCAQALERARLFEREHRVAETLQRAFLPALLPNLPGAVIQAAYVPSVAESEVGGDWYDVFTLPDGKIAMSVGDVVGRGLQAAVIMGQIRQTIRAAALESHAPPMVLDRTGRVLRLTYEAEGMATAIFGIFDPVALTFAYSSAGHPAPLLAHSDGRAEPLPSGGLPLGVHTPNMPPAWTTSLPRGSLLVLYTDGIVESTRNLFEGESALRAAAAAEAGQPSADAARAILTRTIPGAGPPDDAAIVTLRILGAEAARLNVSERATLDAARPLRLALQQFLGEHHIDGAGASYIQVAVGEAINNAIEHAYGAAAGFVELSGWYEGSTLVVEVRDHGRWRAEREEQRGHGLRIMRALASRLDLNTTETGTLVRLEFSVTSGSTVGAPFGSDPSTGRGESRIDLRNGRGSPP